MKMTYLICALFGLITLIETTAMWILIYYAFETEKTWLLPITAEVHTDFFVWSTLVGIVAVILALLWDLKESKSNGFRNDLL